METCRQVIAVTRVQQAIGLCGPASAEMVLTAKGVPGITQFVLWGQVQANTPGPSGPQDGFSGCTRFEKQICERCSKKVAVCWCTHPSALVTTLNQHLGPGACQEFSLASEALVNQRIIASIDQGTPAVVLVFGFQHWVVAHGYRCDGSDGTNVTHLFISDPNDPMDASIQTNGMSLSDWNADFLETVTCGAYLGKIVVVAASTPPVRPPSGVLRTSGGVGAMTNLRPDSILAHAQAEIARLQASGVWDAVLEGVEPAGRPLLVRHLGKGDPYYVVTFSGAGDRATARLVVSAVTGTPGQVWAVRDRASTLPRFIQPEEVLPSLAGRRFEFEGKVIQIGAGSATVDPELVWKGCDQSASKSQPFYVVHQDGVTFYVRSDGEVFEALTRRGAGG